MMVCWLKATAGKTNEARNVRSNFVHLLLLICLHDFPKYYLSCIVIPFADDAHIFCSNSSRWTLLKS